MKNIFYLIIIFCLMLLQGCIGNENKKANAEDINTAVIIPYADLGWKQIIHEMKDQLWACNTDKLYKIENNSSTEIKGLDSALSKSQIAENILNIVDVINKIVDIGDNIWVCTRRGVFKITENEAKLIPESKDINVMDAGVISGNLWFRSYQDFYIVKNKLITKIYAGKDHSKKITQSTQINNSIWYFLDSTYLMCLANEKPLLIDNKHIIDYITKKNGRLLIETKDAGIFINKGDSLQSINRSSKLQVLEDNSYDDPPIIWEISEDTTDRGETIWIEEDIKNSLPYIKVRSAFKVYILNKDSLELISNTADELYNLGFTKNLFWTAERKPIDDNDKKRQYKLKLFKNNALLREIYFNEKIRNVNEVNNNIYIFTSSGKFNAYEETGNAIYKLIEDKLFVVSNFYIRGSFKLCKYPDGTWIYNMDQLYKFYENSRIKVSIKNKSWFIKILEKILPGNYWVSGVIKPEVEYEGISNNKNILNENVKSEFQIILETDTVNYNRAIKKNEYRSYEGVQTFINSGSTTFYISVHDQWGNTFNYVIKGIVIPAPEIIPIFCVFVWIITLLSILILAPYNTFCQKFIMNPWVRGYGSFGVIPLILTLVPYARQHILKRYLLGVRKNSEFIEVQKNFVIPSKEYQPHNFLEVLTTKRKVKLIGRSGIGKTSYFKFITQYLIVYRNNLPKYIPVFLPISRYQTTPISDIILAQLSNYGLFTDQELASWYIKQGGFIIFFDGVNEVNQDFRNRINSFIDQNWNLNIFCISSQESYPEFSGLFKMDLSPLGRDQVIEILIKKLGQAYSSIGPEILDVYKIPQELEFAIEIVEQGNPLPKSKRELYEAILNPVFETWEKEGYIDYPNLLFERSFEMLVEKQVLFDKKNEYLPGDLKNRLVERKFLIQRDEDYFFVHDIIRAFLAAKHVSKNWTILIEGDLEFDANWKTFFEFLLIEINNSIEVGKIMLLILENSPHLAGDMFNFLENEYPLLIDSWGKEFDNLYGKAVRSTQKVNV